MLRRMTAHQALNDRDRAVLEFERIPWTHPGAKDAAIRDRFEVSPVRYYQMVAALLERTEAVAYDATTVGRLQRLADRRRAVRRY